MRRKFVASGRHTVEFMQRVINEYKLIMSVDAYVIDYSSNVFPTSNWYGTNNFSDEGDIGYEGGPLTREELSDLYLKGWTVYVDGKWRTKLYDDPIFALMVKNGNTVLPEGWEVGFRV